MEIVIMLLAIGWFAYTCYLDAKSSIGKYEKFKIYQDKGGLFHEGKYALISAIIIGVFIALAVYMYKADGIRGVSITAAVLAADGVRRFFAARKNSKRARVI